MTAPLKKSIEPLWELWELWPRETRGKSGGTMDYWKKLEKIYQTKTKKI